MTNAKVVAQIKRLKVSSIPGITHDGARVQVKYYAYRKAKRDSMIYSYRARKAKMDMNIYTGILDARFYTRAKELCITVLAMERVEPLGYGYRTFNLARGRVVSVAKL